MKYLMIAPALLLAACGGGAASDAGGDVPFADVLAVTANYTPVFDDGATNIRTAIASDVEGDGVSGFLGRADGTLAPFLVRVSEDGNTAFISIDGADEIALPSSRRGLDLGGGQWTNGDNTLSLRFDGFTAVDLSFNDEVSWFGQGGYRTPTADLPSGDVTYSGDFEMNAAGFDDVEGSLTINVGFGTGGVGGTLEGVAETDDADLALSGIIDGMFSDGLVVGTIVSTDPAVVMDFDMIGAFYEEGEQLNGALAGTLNGTTIGGEFTTDSP